MHNLLNKQVELDSRIAKERGIEGRRDVFLPVACAYMVELGEMLEAGRNGDEDAMTEEFSDMTHFILSMWYRLGLEEQFDVDMYEALEMYMERPVESASLAVVEINERFGRLLNLVPDFKFWKRTKADADMQKVHEELHGLTHAHLRLGFACGILPSHIRGAYNVKHQENHARQNRGY